MPPPLSSSVPSKSEVNVKRCDGHRDPGLPECRVLNPDVRGRATYFRPIHAGILARCSVAAFSALFRSIFIIPMK